MPVSRANDIAQMQDINDRIQNDNIGGALQIQDQEEVGPSIESFVVKAELMKERSTELANN